MKNILLIGNLNETSNAIYKSLLSNYQVQLCKMELNEVEGMVKFAQPDLALISMYGETYFDTHILEHLKGLESPIPVIFVGTIDECREYRYRYNGISYMERPVTQMEILKKCKELLDAKNDNDNLADTFEFRKKKILVVDDNGVFLRNIKLILETQYEVIVAKSGEKALSVAAFENPDLILLDYEMPELDGRQTLEKLRENEQTADIPVVFLTGVNDKEHILEVLKMQPQGYVLKPVDKDLLEKKIVEVIG